jgi:putative PIG3 family NAD(P)H quinone oxidoreductase
MRLGEAPDPVPDAGELLVRVHAAGVNRADLLQRAGKYPPPPGASPLLGLEAAGEVLATGSGVTRFGPGDRVMSLVSGGAYAELVTASESTTFPVPDSLDWAAAGSFPEAFLTAWLNWFTLGQLTEGETVFLHAAASGVGMAAIQLAREAGATVVASAGSDEKLALCRELGATVTVNRHRDDAVAVVKEATAGRGVDLVLDVVGAPTWDTNLALLARGGRLCLVGFLGGATGEVNLGPILRKNLHVTGTTLRGSPASLKARITRELEAFAAPRLADGRLRVVVDRAFPLNDAPAAHRYVADNNNAGKVVLRVTK